MNVSETYNIDCMEGMAKYPDKYFELAICDPPYREKNQPTKDMRAKGAMSNFGEKPSAGYFKELFRVSVNQIVWGANNFIPHLYDTNCFVFWDKGLPLETFADGELAWTSFSYPAKKFHYPIRNENGTSKIHPTQKPVALYRWLLKNYAKPGDKILDTHLGSGSSRIAAHEAGHDFVGFELDKDYFEAQEKRFAKHLSQGRLFEKAA